MACAQFERMSCQTNTDFSAFTSIVTWTSPPWLFHIYVNYGTQSKGARLHSSYIASVRSRGKERCESKTELLEWTIRITLDATFPPLHQGWDLLCFRALLHVLYLLKIPVFSLSWYRSHSPVKDITWIKISLTCSTQYSWKREGKKPQNWIKIMYTYFATSQQL